MQKNIYIGSTILARALAIKKLDGISIYTRAILEQSLRFKSFSVHPCVFGIDPHAVTALSSDMPQTAKIPNNFSTIAALQTVLNCPHPIWYRIEQSFDLFHATDHLIPKLKSKPVVATVMDAIPLTQPSLISSRLRHFKAYAFKKAIQSAQRVITISNFSARELVEHAGISEQKIDVTPLACDQRFFVRFPLLERNNRLLKLGIQRPFFLFVGTIQPRKNVERLIRAYRALPQKILSNHELVIAGGLREDMQDLLPILTQHRSIGNVKWLKYVSDDDLVALMQSSVALVVPSLYEGFGLPVLEGFASQVPVLSSNSSSLPEVCKDAALLFDPMSIEAMREAMISVVDKAELAQSLRARGLVRVRDFSWKHTAELTMESYKRVL
jgi:glycosyltransferase involved in cell wall biosynthesis